MVAINNKRSGARTSAARVRISQTDVPAHSLEQALRVAFALTNFGKEPAVPVQLAAAMDLMPTSSLFKMLTGASIAYGLTVGGYNAAQVALTPLGQRIVKPLSEGDDLSAKREAFIKPRIIREFLTRFDEHPFPKDEIGRNILESLGVPADRADEILTMIRGDAESLGLMQDIKGKSFVMLKGSVIQPIETADEQTSGDVNRTIGGLDGPGLGGEKLTPIIVAQSPMEQPNQSTPPNKKVFITHGKNKPLSIQ